MINYCAHTACRTNEPCLYGPNDTDTLVIMSGHYPPRVPTRDEAAMITRTDTDLGAYFRHARTNPMPEWEHSRGCDGSIVWTPVCRIRYLATHARRNRYALES
jgi:hypothetical protein